MWAAQWIWSEIPVDAPGLGPPQVPPRHLWNRSCLLRRSFTVPSVPDEVWCRVTADSRFVLFVNGAEVTRGPARAVPDRITWIDVDLAPHLRPGANAIAALVRYYGQSTAWWRSATPNGQLGYGSFALEAPALELVTDDTWRAAPGPFVEPPEGAPPLLEVVDGSRLPAGWTDAGFDDTGWASAATLASITVGSRAQTLPVQPFGAMEAAAIAPLTMIDVPAAKVAGGNAAAGGGVLDNPIALYEGGVASAGDTFVTYDFATMTLATPWVEVAGTTTATIVDLYAGEDIGDDGIAVIAPRELVDATPDHAGTSGADADRVVRTSRLPLSHRRRPRGGNGDGRRRH